MESGFCKESPAHLFLNFSCLLELTDSLCMLTEEAERRKLPQVQVSVGQEVKRRDFSPCTLNRQAFP